MKKYFTAKSDLIFQQALCLEKDKDILSWFIGKCFNQKVTDLKIETPVLPIGKVVEKSKTVDLLVTFDKRKVNLEVNSCHYKYLNDRNFSYISDVYSSLFKRGQGLRNRNEVIQLNFTWGLPKKFENIDYFEYEVYDKKHKVKYIDNLKIIVYNMDYYRKKYYNKEGTLKKDAPKHLLMLDANSKKLKELCKGDKIMEKFRDNVEKLNDDQTVIDFLTKEEEDEIKKNSYYAEGKETGKLEEKLDLAKKMIQNSINLETISKITGLTKKELESLK